MGDLKAYVADSVFTGESWLTGHGVLVENGRVVGLPAADAIPEAAAVARFDGAIIAPAFIDVQIYGASGKLFSAWPDEESLRLLAVHNRAGGTTLCLPTIATNSTEVYRKGVDAIRAYWRDGGQGIYGLHLEGPWINAARRGAHVAEWIVQPDLEQVAALLAYGRGVIKMITLAPEVCHPSVISCIREQGIVVSAGHSDASYGEAINAFESGIPTVTHLFNAMSPFHHRAAGLPGAVLDHSSVMASIIPDGIHVDYAAVRIAKAVMHERLFVITDAVTQTSVGPYPHQRAGNKYESGGILSGSALQMNDAVRNLVLHAGISMGEALRMCSLYPAQLLGKEHSLGMLREGCEASLVVLDRQFNVVEVPATRV